MLSLHNHNPRNPHMSLPTSVLSPFQEKDLGTREVMCLGKPHAINVVLRWDAREHRYTHKLTDHNSFLISGEMHEQSDITRRYVPCMGYREIFIAFPEIAHCERWDGMTSEGPVQYFSRTIYNASDRDHDGGRKGDVKHDCWYVAAPTSPRGPSACFLACEHPKQGFGITPEVLKFTIEGLARDYADEHGGTPIHHIHEYHVGKKPCLDAARRSAYWPDATDKDLTAPGLELRLRNRLPALMEQFKTFIESLGFTY